MDFELHVIKGRSTTQALKLIDGVTSVGRQDDCHLRIKSSQVSRKHCELFEKKGMLLVKDLASANGTFVNGKKINGQQVLEPGDEITIGGITLRVVKMGQAAPVPAAPSKPAAGDTAVAEAIPLVEEEDQEEFELDFEMDATPAAGAADADIEDAIELALAGDEAPKPAPVAAPSPAATPSTPPPTETAKAATAPEPSKAPAPPKDEPAAMADEAIADFLLDLKVDDDE